MPLELLGTATCFCTIRHFSHSASLQWLLVCSHSQDLAEHLVIHGHSLTSTDHKELSSLFNLGQESSRWKMDHHVALAMANLNIPPSWNVLGSHTGNGEQRIKFQIVLCYFPSMSLFYYQCVTSTTTTPNSSVHQAEIVSTLLPLNVQNFLVE